MADKVEKKNEAVDADATKSSPAQPVEPTEVPAVMGATFAERAAGREPAKKQVTDDSAENKSIDSGESKGRRPARKKS